MGIFDKIFSSQPKSYDKYGDILKKVMTTKEQRLEAIEALENIAPEQSVPQLLKRFEISVDSGLIDNREKEKCLNIIVEFGEKSKPFVKKIIESQRRISWPIKIAEKIFSHDEYAEILINNLKTNIAVFDESVLERNEEIMLALKEVKGKEEIIVNKVTEFLSSRDENLKMAALECLEEQAKQNITAKEIIINLSNQPVTDENSRFMGVVNSIIQAHKWA
ncbi:hypothetical protein [Fluviispira multicolorata]|uniref:HEAT repeat domain-containing protein n=1 Tax=Fluviispira multicolorata TaxID=2654512 RepID=A0A833N587_9BACT|nr:hypothetical protein [Fluviispira multicolorata]KAB8029912.1 hypothetical protein GCL57_10270 [Fluviispira multicolorata]